MYYPTQTFLVAGLSRSGVAAAELLVARHARAVYLYDDVSDEGVRKNIAHLEQLGCRSVAKEELTASAAGMLPTSIAAVSDAPKIRFHFPVFIVFFPFLFLYMYLPPRGSEYQI